MSSSSASKPAHKHSARNKPAPGPASSSGKSSLLRRIYLFFGSLRLTIVTLAFGMGLVFAGTIAQVEFGLYRSQAEFFHSLFVFWGPPGAAWRIPVYPGGYLIGGVLLVNLVCAHYQRFKFTRKKLGLWLVHVGLILLLAGQFLTDILSRESGLFIFEGQSKNYSEDFHSSELVVIDKSEADTDLVIAIPERLLNRKGEFTNSRLPFPIEVRKYWLNADIARPSKSLPPMAVASGASAGLYKNFPVFPQPPVTDTDHHNTPAMVVELPAAGSPAPSFLVSTLLEAPQEFTANGKTYEILLRPLRYYYPFTITLLKATHEQYRGTDIPKNFASRIRVENPDHNEARETEISMNAPLRYSGLTFYQYQMTAGELAERAGQTASSTLQVVRNPGWLTPYAACVMISAGLVIQFLTHLIGFARKRLA